MNNIDNNDSINDYIYNDNEVIDEINELPTEQNIILGACARDNVPITYAVNTAQCGACIGNSCQAYSTGICDGLPCTTQFYSPDVCQGDSLNDCMSVWKKIIDSVTIDDPNDPQYPDNLRNKHMTYNDLYGYLPALDEIIDNLIEDRISWDDMGDEVWNQIVSPYVDIDEWNSRGYNDYNHVIQFRALDINGNVIDETDSDDPNADRLLRGNDIEYCQRLQRCNLELSMSLILQPWVFTYEYNNAVHTQTTTYKVELKFSYTIKIYFTSGEQHGTYTQDNVIIAAVSPGDQPMPSGSWSVGGNELEHLQNNFPAIYSYTLESNEYATLRIYNISTRFVVATNDGTWEDYSSGTSGWNSWNLDKTITTNMGRGSIRLKYYIEQNGTNVTTHLVFN